MKRIFFLAVASGIFFTGCNKHVENTPPPPPPASAGPDVYVVGNLNGPGYWKNGSFVNLFPDTLTTTAIFVSGNDVYVAGFDHKGPYRLAEYWKNSSLVKLNDSSESAIANGIFVSGSDVYVAGEEIGINVDKAVYWKNGSPVTLSEGFEKEAYANSIYVSGNDVYAAGS